MSQGHTSAGLARKAQGKMTRRERFLAEMDAVIPWAALLALIAPHYATAGRRRQPIELETMLRIYFLQQWFDLSAPQAEDAIHDSEAMRRFAGVALGDDAIPDEATILRFRHLLEQHQLTSAIVGVVQQRLTDRRLLLTPGTIMDATIIAAPGSTRVATARRDAEMRQGREGPTWYWGMWFRIGIGPIHRVAREAGSMLPSRSAYAELP